MVDGSVAPIRCSIVVSPSPKKAFEILVGQFGFWWPIPYTYGEAAFETAEIERQHGGRWFETRSDGARLDWGEVRQFEAEKRLVVSFNVGPDRKPQPPERNSEVEIRFLAVAGGTRIDVEHREFEKHGEGAESLRAGLASPQGWPLILASYAREARRM